MLLQLQAYDIMLIYKQGKHLYLADTLSRSSDTSASQTSATTDAFEVMSVSYISTARLEELRTHTAQDQVLQTLSTVIQHGWPDKECKLPLPIRAFFPYRDELATGDGIIVKGHRAVIPHSLQQDYVNIMHRGHPGLESTKRQHTGLACRASDVATDTLNLPCQQQNASASSKGHKADCFSAPEEETGPEAVL